jgi:methyl-accepting chemotaxis protein
MRQEIKATVLATEQGGRKVKEGTAKAQAAANALERISEMAGNATVAAREISVATEQQRSASAMVASSMGEIALVAHRYEEGTRKSENAVASLANVVNDLHERASSFTT